METKILIVEDEEGIRGFLRINFQRNNYKVLEAGSGEEGINLARIEKPKVAILDVMLPGIDGFKVCETLRREFPSMGIIMLTAKGQDMDKIMGLECGADDYVVKPFNPTELILRTKALLRRSFESSETNESTIIESYPFKIDTYSQKIYKGEEELELTPKEYMLMKIFIENTEKAFSRDELLNLVWGYDFIGDPKIVDVNVRRLRTKIEEEASQPVYIQTVWGTGYRWRK
jgi:two-component system alkaline phosphatase synthesis response regulator PhoP